MNLLVDIGNQNLKWALNDEGGAFSSSPYEFEENFARNLIQLDNVTAVYFVNVAGQSIAEKFRDMSKSTWNIIPTEVLPIREQCGVTNGYRNTSELGADRWASLIRAWAITQQATIVVDCGTAVTVDALSSSGEFVGGSIIPGVHLSHQSLFRRAPGIDEFSRLVPTVPARSTIEAVSSGIVLTVAGGIDLLIDKYRVVIGSSSSLLLTGGDAQLIQNYSSNQFEHVPNLVLQGLSQIVDSQIGV